MPLSKAQVDALRVTGTAKFSTALQAVNDQPYKLFTMQESFGSEGYVPTMLGGLGAGQRAGAQLHQVVNPKRFLEVVQVAIPKVRQEALVQ